MLDCDFACPFVERLKLAAGVSMPSNPNSQSNANPALEQMQLVLVGWPVDQVASLLESKQVMLSAQSGHLIVF